MHKYIMILSVVLMLQCCTNDYIENLGEGYFYRNEGGDLKDILSKKPLGGQIPSTVIDFNYNKNFIIAKQHPKLPQDILYDKEHNYELGTDTIYYWLIIKKKNIVLGPLKNKEFIKVRKLHKVPESLKLK